jgi:hypothetical protein
MTPWKLPPKEKIYEAFSVLADERYVIVEKGKATVHSSTGEKHYTVLWNEDPDPAGFLTITSNDNGSHWQGYTGYPIIAVLMILHKIRFDAGILIYFKSIPWHVLNKANNNDYGKVVEIILAKIDNNQESDRIRAEADHIYSQLSGLNLAKPNSKLKK